MVIVSVTEQLDVIKVRPTEAVDADWTSQSAFDYCCLKNAILLHTAFFTFNIKYCHTVIWNPA